MKNIKKFKKLHFLNNWQKSEKNRFLILKMNVNDLFLKAKFTFNTEKININLITFLNLII